MNGPVFRHDELRNHVYNQSAAHKDGYDGKGKAYFSSLDGEFAIGFESGGNVVLARDWVGSVPFHFMITGSGDVVTANDIKTLMEHPEYDYMRVRAVRAGHVVTVPLEGRFTEKDVAEERYVPSLHDMKRVKGSVEDVGRNIRERLVTETGKRLEYAGNASLALSGGIDSFSVALALAELGRIKDVDAYCINTDGKGVDWPNAVRAAKYLGLRLNEVRASRQRTVEVIPHAIHLAELYKDYDIFCAVACYLLGEGMRRDGVKNIFTGDGANECFRDYTSWGCFEVDREKIISQEMGARILEGRKDPDPVKSSQLGSGYAKSASRGSKVFPCFGIDTFNPFLAQSVATYVSKIPIEDIAEWDVDGQPLWKKRIMMAAFPEVPGELFPLKTRMQDGVGTTDTICNIRRMDLLKHGREGGFAKYGRGALDTEFQQQNPEYYTDLFRRYFRDLFVGRKPLESAEHEWKTMLHDLELGRTDARGWHHVELSRPHA